MVEVKTDKVLALTNPLLQSIGAIADEEGQETYVVGGYVRDYLLGLGDKDIDILVIGDGVEFAKIVARRLRTETVVVHERFGTAMVPLDGGKVEFVSARKERYHPDSRKPIVDAGSLEEDLLRRDFTVNAIAVSLNKERFGIMYDPFKGREALQEKVLRTPLDPEKTFEDDPLRIMRAIRFASQLGFQIEETVLDALTAMKDRLSIVSQERITDEFLKILKTPKPSVGLRLMFDSGVMHIVFPEVAQMSGVDQRKDVHHKDVFLHTCIVVDNVAQTSNNLWLRFTALVHDIAKPKTKAFKEGIGWTFHGHEELGARMMKSIFRRLKLPMDPMPYVEKLVRLHLRPMVLVSDEVTDAAVRRLVFEAGNDIDDLMKLCRADITSKNPQLVAKYLRNYDIVMKKIVEVEEKDRLRNWQPPVRGDEIMAVCGIPEGRKVGELKKAIEEAVLEGTIPNEHDAALEFLLKIKDEILNR
ncbi:MAG: HD domain-containing protein [Ignavibacteriae bacterium]|nr:HD domain-containing protein [Ignavibacteriota bacterium]